jgi:DNA-3-methyladenine glycosylase I
MKRCTWVPKNNDLYTKYHDEEWGVPVFDDAKLFEFLVLEGAQAGLSWETILKRRDTYKKAFANWDVKKVSKFDPELTGKTEKVLELLQDPGIIRNKLKVKSAINNAQQFIKVQEEFGSFSKYIWQFVNAKPIQNKWKKMSEVPAQTELSQQISKDLKKRGFTFVGPTIMYAHMQATGMVNDHSVDCFRYNEVIKKV